MFVPDRPSPFSHDLINTSSSTFQYPTAICYNIGCYCIADVVVKEKANISGSINRCDVDTVDFIDTLLL